MLAGLYAITEDSLLPESRLVETVEEVLSSGCKLLQYRSKIEDWDTRVRQAKSLQSLCYKHNVPLVINDSVKLCTAVGAAGVHLGKQDTSIEEARKKLGADHLIGVTCHNSIDTAIAAEKAGADYVAFGRFYSSKTKPEASPASPFTLKEAKKNISIPIVAIGGINSENGAVLIKAGADMLAVVNAIFGAENIAKETLGLVDLFNNSEN